MFKLLNDFFHTLGASCDPTEKPQEATAQTPAQAPGPKIPDVFATPVAPVKTTGNLFY